MLRPTGVQKNFTISEWQELPPHEWTPHNY